MRFVPEGLLDDKGVGPSTPRSRRCRTRCWHDGREVYGIAHRYDTLPYLALSVTPAGLDALAANETVASVVPDGLVAPSLFTSVPQVEGDEARGFGFTGNGQTMAIVDTGVDSAHPMLTGRVLSEACFALTTPFLWITSGDCAGGAASAVGAGTGAPCSRGHRPRLQPRHPRRRHRRRRGNGAIAADGAPPAANMIAIQNFHRENNAAPAPRPAPRRRASWPARATRWPRCSTSSRCAASPHRRRQPEPRRRRVHRELRHRPAEAGDRQPALGPDRDRRGRGQRRPIAPLSAPVHLDRRQRRRGQLDATASRASRTPPRSCSCWRPAWASARLCPAAASARKSGTSMATPHVTGAFAVLRQAQPGASVATLQNLLRRPAARSPTPERVVTPRIRILTALAQLGLLRRSGESFRQTVPVGGLGSDGIGLARRLGASGSGTITINSVPRTSSAQPSRS